MKHKLRFLLLPVCCAAVVFSAGCNNKTYGVYTNMPQDGYKITDNSFRLDGYIEGYETASKNYEEVDASVFTTINGSYWSMSAEAVLVVSDDFTTDEAKEKGNRFLGVVQSKLYEIESALSASRPNSDISNFNNAAQGARIEIKQITYEVLSEAKSVYEFTGGCYNPALYYNVIAYGFNGDNEIPANASELPADAVIAKYTDLASHFGDLVLEKVEDGDKTIYYATKPLYTVEIDGETMTMKLDLGGIGKGYAVDCVDRLFDEYGYKFGYFNFGTSSMLVKSNYREGSYNLSLTNPRSPSRDTYLTTVIRDEKLSSSGDYERYYFIDGTRYCHIINPRTGKPVRTGIMSATVIGGSAAQDDALTTAIMAMEKDEAVKFIEEKLTDKRVVFTFE